MTTSPWILLICLWPVALLLIWLIINSHRDNRDAELVIRSLDWPETQGRVVGSEVVWGHVSVKYEYSVESRCFEGNYNISMTPRAPDRYGRGAAAFSEEALDAMDDYPAGSDVVIRYNPKRPQQSVLFRGGKISPSNEERVSSVGS